MTDTLSNSQQLDLTKALARFGLNAFRPGQRDVINSVLDGRDCLCVMPTGGGKSLCYQLPSVVRKGTTLVISPLIALMKDQVDSLQKLNIKATCINSALEPSEQRLRIEQLANGGYDLVYIAPERLRSPSFQSAVKQTHVQLLAIDEAHCISEWGHDFRPDYARLGRFRERLGNPQTIALTATATDAVRRDIVTQLCIEASDTFITGFARENLRFEVQHPSNFAEKDKALLDYLKENKGSGIIYASTRKRCEALVELVGKKIRRKVGCYHAGLDKVDRRSMQEAFMSGEIPVIIATNAFGMGIDKPDLRFVVHYNIPGTLEAYYQEAGRAGRDGKPSRCMLLFSYPDKKIQEFFIENSYPEPATVKCVYEFLRSIDQDTIELTIEEVKEAIQASVGSEGVGACEQLLEKSGAIERLDSQQNMAAVRIDSQMPSLVDYLPREARTRRRVLREIEREIGDFRGERVYFHPADVAKRLGLKIESLQRALRELNKLEPFNYVPPFRGKAIHVVDRSKRFEDLNIDFKEVDRRRQGEYGKLDSVVKYSYTRDCRQLAILDYFGDPNRERCYNCDCCDGKSTTSDLGDVQVTQTDQALNYVAKIALSGVVRTKGRAGKILVAQMLCGSTAKGAKRLKNLSTFGLLSRLSQTDVKQLMDALLRAKLISQVETQRMRPVVEITPEGRSVMAGTELLGDVMAIPTALRSKITTAFKSDAQIHYQSEDNKRIRLQQELSKASTNEAKPSKAEEESERETENEPPAQMKLKRARPTAELELEFVSDHVPIETEPLNASADVETEEDEVDEADVEEDEEDEDNEDNEELDVDDDESISQLENHFESELNFGVENEVEYEEDDEKEELDEDVQGEDDESNVSSESDEEVVEDEPEHDSILPSESFWTLRLFQDGYTLNEVSAIRRLRVDTIVRHMVDIARAGHEVKLDWILSTKELKAVALSTSSNQSSLELSKSKIALIEAVRQ